MANFHFLALIDNLAADSELSKIRADVRVQQTLEFCVSQTQRQFDVRM